MSLAVGVPFLTILVAVPFLSTWTLKATHPQSTTFVHLFFHAFGVVFFFNLFDWLLLDWLVFCTLTPRRVVIPGTEGMAGYKDYGHHFRAFLVGTLLALGAGLTMATLVSQLWGLPGLQYLYSGVSLF
jgi:hypothetical protein